MDLKERSELESWSRPALLALCSCQKILWAIRIRHPWAAFEYHPSCPASYRRTPFALVERLGGPSFSSRWPAAEHVVNELDPLLQTSWTTQFPSERTCFFDLPHEFTTTKDDQQVCSNTDDNLLVGRDCALSGNPCDVLNGRFW